MLAAARVCLRNGGSEIGALRVQGFVGQVFVSRAVQLVCSGLSGEVVQPAAHLAELG